MKSPNITHLLDEITGHNQHFALTRSEALEQNKCCVCGKNATSFSDQASKSEYALSAMCQICQDKIFGKGIA